MADSQGNTLEYVGVAQTARVAVKFASGEAVPPTLEELQAFPPLPEGYLDLGLLVEDGGYAPEPEVGDKTPLYQKGYFVSTGEEHSKFKLKFAEMSNTAVRRLCGIHENVQKTLHYRGQMSMIIATRYANYETFLYGGVAEVTDISYEGNSAGDINAVEITFEWIFKSDYCGYNRSIIIRDESECNG